MSVALWLFAIQGVIGAFDTLYYHEWRARLPARGKAAAPELKIHAVRDFLYTVLFGSLPWLAWHGMFLVILAGVILAEIILTFWDFIVEIPVRKSLGDVYAGERITHALMAILYGGVLANLIPTLLGWWSLPSALALSLAPIPDSLRWGLLLMAGGVFVSGVRDLYAALELPNSAWPWDKFASYLNDTNSAPVT